MKEFKAKERTQINVMDKFELINNNCLNALKQRVSVDIVIWL